MSVLLLPPIFQFFDNNGDPLANGFVDTFAAGTTTRLATYTDSTGLTAAPNPIQLNAAGRPTSGSGAIWGEGAYKFVVRDSAGVQVGDALDNVISFAGLAPATNSYAQTFSGDGVTTVFTTSSSLGTDPKALLVSVANGLQEIAQNGSFATDTLWTKGAGWTIGSGVATATGAISTAISQVPVIPIVVGQAYAVTYTITRSAGGLIPSIGGQNGVERTASGTYREIIIAAATTPIAFTGNAFTGTLDNVSITEAVSENMALLPSNAYTINGTTLTFASAPALGLNNIDVRAPSLLLGAASTAANLATLSAAAALVSETNAASSAALASSNVKTRPAVACATTANITLSGEQTIDTVLTSASRVLVKNQSLPENNGVYVSAAGAWTRATDADTFHELHGQSVFTSGGSVNINRTWANTNNAGGTLGVTEITWTELNPGMLTGPVYDPAGIAQQVVGTTATQTLTNKTLTNLVSNGTISGTATPKLNNFRLTLTTGVPVTTSDVTAASTIFLTPYNGNGISLYNGTTWELLNSAQVSIALSGLVAGHVYDLFTYSNAGVLAIDPPVAWANSTVTVTIAAPGVFTWNSHPLQNGDLVFLTTTGALPTGLAANTQYFVVNAAANTFQLSLTDGGVGITTTGTQSGVHTAYSLNRRATALAYQDGVLVKSGAATRRYVGSFVAVTATTTEDSAKIRGLYNYSNRVGRRTYGTIPTSSWTYTIATIRPSNNNTTVGEGRTVMVIGVPEDALRVHFGGQSNQNTAAINRYNSVGHNTVAIYAGNQVGISGSPNVSSGPVTIDVLPFQGFNFIQMLEFSNAGGVTTWYGASASVSMHSLVSM